MKNITLYENRFRLNIFAYIILIVIEIDLNLQNLEI